jgi:hypothetical protein
VAPQRRAAGQTLATARGTDSKLESQRKQDDARRPGRRPTTEIVLGPGAAGIEFSGGVQRNELLVVERIVNLSAGFENPLLIQADILGAAAGVSNLRAYAATRGETMGDFLETRNAPGAFYSVTAKPKAE